MHPAARDRNFSHVVFRKDSVQLRPRLTLEFGATLSTDTRIKSLFIVTHDGHAFGRDPGPDSDALSSCKYRLRGASAACSPTVTGFPPW